MTEGIEGIEGIEEFYGQATGHPPYPWQKRVAEKGLPELLEVPTGCGKTLGVLLGWLYRRRFHPDPSIRRATPRKLIFTLPMRTLVEQTRDEARRCLEALGLTGEIELATLMGGEPTSDGWRLYPERESIVVCTLDMGLSGALNRGYATSRFSWPITFGMLNHDAHWIFDEVQLMGPAAATSRQLQAFRDSFGTSLPSSSTWMTATLDMEQLRTVDAPAVAEPFTLSGDAEPPALKQRLDAPRRFGRWLAGETPSDAKALADARASAIIAAHRPGTRTLAIVNTVATARMLHAALGRAGFSDAILLHSRFRPPDRRTVIDRVLAPPGPEGTIVVSTQVIEAGVDLTSATMFTEVAPWPSIVQRAGRCNRYGEVTPDDVTDAPRVLWDRPKAAAPYRDDDLDLTIATLEGLDDQLLTTRELAAIDVELPEPPVTQVIRRADLVRLFDTAPDLGGNDLDVGPWLRDGNDLDVRLCWRELGADSQPTNRKAPGRAELCPAPIGDVKTWLTGKAKAVRLETLDGPVTPGRRRPRRWVAATQDSIRPGQVLVVDAKSGGYSPAAGWDPSQKGLVGPLQDNGPSDLAPVDETMGEDPASTQQKRWVTLDRHLRDVRDELGHIFEAVKGLPSDHVRSAIEAGRWHDLGKTHEVFQETLQHTLPEPDQPHEGGPWAKSGGPLDARHSRPYFRHELASALALLGEAGEVIDRDADRDLVIYLVGAHHGRVRMSIRSFPGERPSIDHKPAALGVIDGDPLPGGELAGRTVPDTVLSLDVMELGGEARSWVALATDLRDREDLGPFRLAHLEALVRVADWRVSGRYDKEGDPS